MSIFKGLFRSGNLSRDAAERSSLAPNTSHLTLFHFQACPFCQRVRAVIDRLRLNIDLRDTRRDPAAYRELIEGGGRSMVPCLLIQDDDGRTQWLYESADIIAYLNRHFSA